MENFKNNLRTYWPYLLIFILAIGVRLMAGARSVDDSFITFRYARNLLAGHGFVYNPGERVLGTTTPLYTLLMALLALPFGGTAANFPQIALVVNALADGFGAVLLAIIGARFGHKVAGIGVGLVWAVHPYSVTFSIGGMETSVYMLLFIATLAAYRHGNFKLTGLLSALVLLTRPDGLMLILPLGFDRVFFDVKRRGVKLTWRELAAFFVPVGLWVSFATFYFGSPIPHSVTAKVGAYQVEALAGLVRFLQLFATPFAKNYALGGAVLVGVGLFAFPIFFFIGARAAFKQFPESWPFIAYPWFHFAAYAIANVLVFRWYLTPPLPFYLLFILIGVSVLMTTVFEGRMRLRVYQGLGLVVLVLLPVFSSLSNWVVRPEHGLQRPAPRMAWYALELVYMEVGEMLADEFVGNDKVLAAGDVGALGYLTDARILDTVGLMSPETLGYYPLPPEQIAGMGYAVSPDLIFDELPDFVVMLEVYMREGLLKDPRFMELYDLYARVETDIYDSEGMLVFVKK